jgi:hypothetical protein
MISNITYMPARPDLCLSKESSLYFSCFYYLSNVINFNPFLGILGITVYFTMTGSFSRRFTMECLISLSAM